MNPFGQIGQQVADNTIEIIKDTAKSVVKAGTDIATGTAEQITGAPSSKGAQQGDKSIEQGKSASDPNAIAQKKSADKRRFDEVNAELQQYIQRKRQQDVRIAQEKASQQQEEKRNEQVKKQESDNWLAKMMRRSSTHGEMEKQKE